MLLYHLLLLLPRLHICYLLNLLLFVDDHLVLLLLFVQDLLVLVHDHKLLVDLLHFVADGQRRCELENVDIGGLVHHFYLRLDLIGQRKFLANFVRHEVYSGALEVGPRSLILLVVL